MSWLRSMFQGMRLRTATPEFEVDGTINVNVTGFDEERGVGIARVGDTILTIDGATAEDVDRQYSVRVTEFDTDDHTGHAELIR